MNARIGDLAGRGPIGPKQGKPKRGTKEGRSHMGRVAQLPCMICKSWPVEVHHVCCGRFGQLKEDDFKTIPLCPYCHRIGPLAIHNGKESWEARNGPDYGFLPVVAAMLDTETEIDF